MTNSQKMPWARLVAEGVVILCSILAAFAIDAWWEERLEREDEQRYLGSLHQEFLQSLELVVQGDAVRVRALASSKALIDQVQGAARATDESLLYDFSLLSRPLDIIPRRAVLDDLLSSGGTLLIRSDEIRSALARYNAALKYSDQASRDAWAVWEGRIQPFLEGRVPRVDRLRFGAYSLDRGIGPENFPLKSSVNERDFDGVLADPAFEDMLAERWLRVENAVQSSTVLNEIIEEIIRLIESELALNE
jgi:hypothetical protein